MQRNACKQDQTSTWGADMVEQEQDPILLPKQIGGALSASLLRRSSASVRGGS